MIQLRYALNDLWRSKGTSFILLLESLMLLIIVNLVIYSAQDMNQMKSEINRLNQSENIYGFVDFTSDEQYNKLLSDDRYRSRLSQLYDEIYENDQVKAFPLYTSQLNFEKHTFGDSASYTTTEKNVLVPFLYTNDLFFDYFNIGLAEGRSFSNEDYNEDSSVIPVLIGSDLAAKFKVGDQITPSGNTQYEVIGVLKKESSYIDIMATREFQSLDRMIVMPLNKNNIASAGNYSGVIPRAYIATDNEAHLSKIVKRADELDTFSFAFKSMLYQSKFVAQDKTKSLQTQILLSSLILVFTFVTVTVSYLQFIEKHTYEFGVHILSGATIKDLMLRLISQFALLQIISVIIVSSLPQPLANPIASLGVSVLLLFVFLIIPLLRLNKMPMTSMLRGRSR
ncbi:ABC transporter permease [Saccharibacillus sp. JS10]|uniref:ABC transporter permease n=1 Tax=Saccharibacillus sp. JS10 TaxID=2950552 RepID=UPI00210A836C|nr:ABC transporter permease [Saccharibacillus sp. JS10]MCQ4087505.1 ABC transporter permease [Saccharibacillus sp. JS10]